VTLVEPCERFRKQVADVIEAGELEDHLLLVEDMCEGRGTDVGRTDVGR
jgi:hypothetical protein